MINFHLKSCRGTFAHMVEVVFPALPASFSKYAVHSQCYDNCIYHKIQSVFYLQFSIAFSNNSRTLCFPVLESASPTLDGRGAKDTEVSLFMWNQM